MDWRREGLADIMKQGFMKPRRKKMVSVYRVWVNDPDIGDCVIATTDNKQFAINAANRAKYVGQTYLRTVTSKELR